MQNPPPPPPPSSGPPAGNMASPGLRIVGGLIDFVILLVVNGIISLIFQKAQALGGLISLVLDLAYFGYFWSSRGASIGMMPFGFKVRDMATGQYPSMGKAVLRGFIWSRS